MPGFREYSAQTPVDLCLEWLEGHLFAINTYITCLLVPRDYPKTFYFLIRDLNTLSVGGLMMGSSGI
jgi:hypothetical protein